MQFRTSHSFAACLAAAALVGSVAAHADLVTNGGFEANCPPGGDYGHGFTIPGWTAFGAGDFTGADTNAPHSGSCGAFFGEPVAAPSGIFQTLATTPGSTYAVDFWVQNEADVNGFATPNTFTFNWNGGPAELTLTNQPAFGYTEYHFLLLATSATTDLRFTFGQDAAFWDLDDVSAVVPEPGTLALVSLAGLVGLARRRRIA